MTGMDGMMSEQDIQALTNAQGVDASKLFLTQMIQHHQGAITMAQSEIKSGQYSPLLPWRTRSLPTSSRRSLPCRRFRARCSGPLIRRYRRQAAGESVSSPCRIARRGDFCLQRRTSIDRYGRSASTGPRITTVVRAEELTKQSPASGDSRGKATCGEQAPLGAVQAGGIHSVGWMSPGEGWLRVAGREQYSWPYCEVSQY